MEILSEEDDSVKTHEDEDLDEDQDDEELEDFQKIRDQFNEQQALLGELKGVLKSNTDKLANKEREVQVSVSFTIHSSASHYILTAMISVHTCA